MMQKIPILPHRIRKIPKQFSWVDHRLVRDHFLERLSNQGAALYLFLVTVADAKGLSYYSDTTLSKRLGMEIEIFKGARRELIEVGLIAWKRPLYQVLPIGEKTVHAPVSNHPHEASIERSRRANSQLISIRQLLTQVGKDD